MNLVVTGKGQYVEIQGTAEKSSFSGTQLQEMLALGSAGIRTLVGYQETALGARANLKRLMPLA